jgi:hypothetical protein
MSSAAPNQHPRFNHQACRATRTIIESVALKNQDLALKLISVAATASVGTRTIPDLKLARTGGTWHRAVIPFVGLAIVPEDCIATPA